MRRWRRRPDKSAIPEQLPAAFPNFTISPDGLFSADFYHDITDPQFARLFAERVQLFTTQSPVHVRLRSTPFFFTECPGCAIVVLTNRPADRALRCRQCGHVAPAPLNQVRGPQTDSVLAEVYRQLGRAPRVTAGYIALVRLQLPDTRQAAEVAGHCRAAGFQFVPADDPQALMLQMLNQDRRVPSHQVPGQQAPDAVFAIRRYPDGTVMDPTVAPPDVEALTSTLRSRFGAVLSLSTTYEIRADDPLALLLAGDLSGCETLLRGSPLTSAAGWWVVLARFSLLTGDAEGALRQAGQATLSAPGDAGAWLLLGEVQLSLSQLTGAHDSLTTAQRLDPAMPNVAAALAECHDLLGDHAAAREQAQRAIALGYPRPPGGTSS